MPKIETVDAYLAALPEATREILDRVRSTIRKAVPGAKECITYQMPTYKLHGVAVIFFAGWKAHFSIYPANARVIAKFKTEMAPYEVNDKGTIKFPLTSKVPVKLIAGIAKFRAQEVSAAHTAAPTSAGKRRS